RAVATTADFPEISPEEAFVGDGPMNFRDLSRNVMARGKVLYEGHAVAAVAAVSSTTAAEALDLIEVEYEVLPHVIDVRRRWRPPRRCCTMTSSRLGSNRSRINPPTLPSG
ncbi:MAG: hypothetical protein ACJ8AH_19370, partial [Stellaceae bacterium]